MEWRCSAKESMALLSSLASQPELPQWLPAAALLQLPAAGAAPGRRCRQIMRKLSNGACHHLLHLSPSLSVWLHQHMRTIKPVHIPVLKAMDLAVLVHVCAELVARAAPAELPAPVSLWLFLKCMWRYVVKG